jgi:hypothetical protein
MKTPLCFFLPLRSIDRKGTCCSYRAAQYSHAPLGGAKPGDFAVPKTKSARRGCSYARPQLAKGQSSGIGRARPRGEYYENLARQRAEVGTKMHRTLQHQDALFRGLNTQVAKHSLVRGLLFATGNGDAHSTDSQQRHRAEIHVRTQIKGPGADKATIAQSLDEEFRGDWSLAFET